MKIERRYMAHYLNAAFGCGEASYTRMGQDLEEYAPELTANVEKKSNILGQTSVVIDSYQKQGEVSPYYAEEGDPLFEKLQAIIDGDLVLDDLKTDIVEVKLWSKDTAGAYPADPNLYHRFFAAGKTLERYDAELTAALGQLGGDEQQRAAAGLALLQNYDGRIKRLLGEIFGAENDFDAILNGVNLAGVGANGRRVVQNLLEALTPILREGAERRLHAAADAAEAAAQAARAARGAE